MFFFLGEKKSRKLSLLCYEMLTSTSQKFSSGIHFKVTSYKFHFKVTSYNCSWTSLIFNLFSLLACFRMSTLYLVNPNKFESQNSSDAKCYGIFNHRYTVVDKFLVGTGPYFCISVYFRNKFFSILFRGYMRCPPPPQVESLHLMGHLRIQIFTEITREREHSLTYVMCTKLSPVCDSYVHKPIFSQFQSQTNV
jgi:hypothetical protein